MSAAEIVPLMSDFMVYLDGLDAGAVARARRRLASQFVQLEHETLMVPGQIEVPEGEDTRYMSWDRMTPEDLRALQELTVQRVAALHRALNEEINVYVVAARRAEVRLRLVEGS